MARIAEINMGRGEFIALMAVMFATVAFSVDAMLTALPRIAMDLGLADPQHAAWILTVFLAGLGIGTLIAGPLSDALGRRPIVFGGLVIYIAGALWAWQARSLEALLIARALQGLGAAGPRVVSMAIIRDLFQGRDMAAIMSMTLMIFVLMPAAAPMFGAGIVALAGWRTIFLSFVIFACAIGLWFALRLPETLSPDRRRPLRLGLIASAITEIVAHPTTRRAILVQTLMMASLFSLLTMIQPVFEQSFDRAQSFPFWFGAIAVTSAISSLINARLVGRFGMRRMITIALALQVIVSSLVLFADLCGANFMFYVFLGWLFGVFLQAGLTTANLNALAMEPMGHIAGIAASVTGAFSTVGGALIATPVALFFDGTPRPLVLAVLILVTVALILMWGMRKIDTTPDIAADAA